MDVVLAKLLLNFPNGSGGGGGGMWEFFTRFSRPESLDSLVSGSF